jgi:hypothetical protein
LNLSSEKLVSNFAFKCNLYRYNEAETYMMGGAGALKRSDSIQVTTPAVGLYKLTHSLKGA